MATYRLRARSVIHPGNFLVQGSDGCCYIYFADVGELSVTKIEHSLAQAMMQSYEWSPIDNGDLVTLDELQSLAASHVQPSARGPDIVQPDR